MQAGLAVAACIVLASCASVDDSLARKGAGIAQTIDASPAAVWDALPGVIPSLGFTVVRENRAEGYLLAQQQHLAPAFRGDSLAVLVEPLGTAQSLVEVVVRHQAGTIVAAEWTPDFFKKLRAAVRKAP